MVICLYLFLLSSLANCYYITNCCFLILFGDLQHQKGLKSNSWFYNNNSPKTITNTNKLPPPPSSLLNNDSMIKKPPPSLYTLDPSITKNLNRRSYATNSVKIRQVQVGPSSFSKIKMLGKGDVGKVYLVKQKGTDKTMAMNTQQHLLSGLRSL